MKKHNQIKKIVLLGILTAIMIIMSMTPIGYVPIGPVEITLNAIPVAIAAVTLGPIGGTIVGAIFGITSFLLCFGLGVGSALGESLLSINPFLTAVVCIIPRTLAGLLVGFIFKGFDKWTKSVPAYFITGFFSAFLNTVLFMASLYLAFGQTDFFKELMDGHSALVGMCILVGVNAIVEMIVTPAISGSVCTALKGAKLIPFIEELKDTEIITQNNENKE